MNRIDLGIALCHFDLACQELGIDGGLEVMPEAVAHTPENGFYTMSWIRKEV